MNVNREIIAFVAAFTGAAFERFGAPQRMRCLSCKAEDNGPHFLFGVNLPRLFTPTPSTLLTAGHQLAAEEGEEWTSSMKTCAPAAK